MKIKKGKQQLLKRKLPKKEKERRRRARRRSKLLNLYDSDYEKKLTELKKKEKILKDKEKEIKKKEEDLKAKPVKRGRKKTDYEDEEKVDVISIQYTIDPGRPNAELNGTFATAVIDDLIGFNEDFSKEDVSF